LRDGVSNNGIARHLGEPQTGLKSTAPVSLMAEILARALAVHAGELIHALLRRDDVRHDHGFGGFDFEKLWVNLTIGKP